MSKDRLPDIIQGGMGVGISHWYLARETARPRIVEVHNSEDQKQVLITPGQMGVISATGVDTTLIRVLQNGDPDGRYRWALSQFPRQDIANYIINKFFVEGGIPQDQPFKLANMVTPNSLITHPETPDHLVKNQVMDLVVAGVFAEVTLAKTDPDIPPELMHLRGPIGVNLLTKIEDVTIPSIYGAMMADADAILMGAGIPSHVPNIIDSLSRGRITTQRLSVTGAIHKTDKNGKVIINEEGKAESDYVDENGNPKENGFTVIFNPRRYYNPPTELDYLTPPKFIPIVSSHTLAKRMLSQSPEGIFGFVVEGPTAGGHNAPPRGKFSVDKRGQPIYTKKDEADLEEMNKLGVPYWLAGSWAHPDRLRYAQEMGAVGVQLGTIFAMCSDSGMAEKYRKALIIMALAEKLVVLTDGNSSPTGFPFKVAMIAGTESALKIHKKRRRICNIGRLRELYKKSNEKLGFRCASEPIDDYKFKGGDISKTRGKKCLCNKLYENLGLGQRLGSGRVEPGLVTLGDDTKFIHDLIDDPRKRYRASDVLNYMQFGIRLSTIQPDY